ncbi:ribosome biogenesis protein SLX9-domain-containing protein [Ganoderma leucocontextum]|nr:ribosome biogenesis protein SLX9-domain-containing protein [Ganoderma leucocontextum]
MPKERRRRSGAHEQSVRLPSQREFAVQDNAVEHVSIGEQNERSAAEILADMAADQEPHPTLKKKEKQALKHQLFIERLEQTRFPYSKSHERRLKRKAREQVAGGMSEIKAAISALEDDMPEAIQNAVAADEAAGADAASRPQKARPKPGQIGEGKGVPLSKNQRKRTLQVERMRIPMILATPEFAANPFQTIRMHAQNSLLKHEPPTAASTSG